MEQYSKTKDVRDNLICILSFGDHTNVITRREQRPKCCPGPTDHSQSGSCLDGSGYRCPSRTLCPRYLQCRSGNTPQSGCPSKPCRDSDFCFPPWIHLPSRPQLPCVYRLLLLMPCRKAIRQLSRPTVAFRRKSIPHVKDVVWAASEHAAAAQGSSHQLNKVHHGCLL
ncbi:uncharacterized protein LJ206_006030 isoform 1-T1 [Theristicus caerulescens]